MDNINKKAIEFIKTIIGFKSIFEKNIIANTAALVNLAILLF